MQTDARPADETHPPVTRRALGWAIAGLIIALSGNGSAVGLAIFQLWPIPSGTVVRPMNLYGELFFLTIATVLGVILLLWLGNKYGRWVGQSNLIAVIAIVLALAPFPVGKLTIRVIASTHSWTLDDQPLSPE